MKTGGGKFTGPLSAARAGVVLWVSRRKPRVKPVRERAEKKRRHFIPGDCDGGNNKSCHPGGNNVLDSHITIEPMTRIFYTGLTALAIFAIAACAPDQDTVKKPKPHRFGDAQTQYPDQAQPTPTPTPEPQSEPQPTPPLHTEVKTPGSNEPATKKGDVPYATPVPGKPGFVTSPFAPYSGYVDVRGFPPSTEVKCPYTGKTFLVP